MDLPWTKDRVPEHTSKRVNYRIKRAMYKRVTEAGEKPGTIFGRLLRLDREWDIERAIEANASALAFIGTALGYFIHPYWLAVPALVTAFLFQHALQGWCPPVPILRRLGFRTAYEIEQERHALKALRGDYREIDSSSGAAALRVAEV
jgi:hypothetical protein